ncbi:MAG TPA: hypothetical protein VNI84_19815 [Pyrinomonadaceae bacterium]|nr:hypothetical protein [Pyrinomonadaceae bacterium]
MQRLITRFAILLLTFIIGFAAQSIWSKKDDIINRCGEFILRGQD